MRRCSISCFVLVCVALFASSTVLAAEPEKLSLDVGGVQREALVYVPAQAAPADGAPLVFVFHGHGGTMQSAARSMQFQAAWPEAIVIYMQGLNTPTRIDPDGKRPGWQRSLGDQKDRDLKFFDTVLSVIGKKHAVDKQRIYVTGFSNGAVFTYLLWAERPNVFAALAPCAGLPLPNVHVKVPKPVFIVAGETDPLVKVSDQRAMIKKLCELDGAADTGKAVGNGAMFYASDHGTPIETLVHPGGHLMPRDAPKLIVDFFREHALEK